MPTANPALLLELRPFTSVTTHEVATAANEYNNSLLTGGCSPEISARRAACLQTIHCGCTTAAGFSGSALALMPSLLTWSRRVTRELRFTIRALDERRVVADHVAPEVICPDSEVLDSFHEFRTALPSDLISLRRIADLIVTADDTTSWLLSWWNRDCAGRAMPVAGARRRNAGSLREWHDTVTCLPAEWRRQSLEISAQALELGEAARERLAHEHPSAGG